MAELKDVLQVQAPAKVNLTLRIVSKLPDGYHELDSVMQKVDLFDTLSLRRLVEPGIQLSCPDSDLPEDDSNLVFQAAASFLRATGLAKTHGVSIVLEKRIPVAAGLGGGSSDAGAVLTGLNRLFVTELPEEQLLSLAVSLGADVSFFVVSSSAVRAKGIGERMTPVASLSDCSVLLVNPGFSVSTAWVYENFTLTRADKVSILSDSREEGVLRGGCLPLYNDLESVTVGRYPEIENIKEIMLENGAQDALMSGSGPTVFGIFPDSTLSDMQKCADKLGGKYEGGVFITRPLA
jgi:4-diphosphocytidyl-2-C-methyl-D-erythritol kinase